jgi:biopolymer transport protein ExbB/TolQ
MYVILFVSVFALAVGVERFFFLFFRFNINADAFMTQIQKLVMANNIDRAIKLCNAAGTASLPKVIKAGLTRANKGEVEISNAVEEATLEVLPAITKRTESLTQIAQIATYLGLLGTIQGMILAFEAVAHAAPEKKAEVLAGSISIAMNTTFTGLAVAIPTTVVYVFLNGITKKIIQEIDLYSVKIQNLLISRGKGAQE